MVDRAGIFRHDAYVTTHDLHISHFAVKRTVFIQDKSFRTDTHSDLLIRHTGDLQDPVISDIQAAAPDRTVEYIDRRCSQELGNEQVAGVVIDLLWLTDLLNHAQLHNHDIVGDGHCLLLVVGDKDRSDLGFSLNSADLLTGLQSQSCIQVGKRLIQQQRVAIARALVKMPRVLLLDEPLSNLDARLRLQTREEIRRIQRETKITTVFVTHDQEEAMSISDYIVVMKLGVVQQIGQPQKVYDDPCNLFVAKFLGTPPINVFNGTVKGGNLFIVEDQILEVPGVADQEVTVGIRPEGFILDVKGPFLCRMRNVEVMGRDVSIVSENDGSVNPIIRSIVSADSVKEHITLDQKVVSYSVKPHKVFIFHKDDEKRIYLKEK